MRLAANGVGWSAMVHRSRCGASHRRRDLPCQDWSLTESIFSADGLPIGLMTVADGHGGRRYWLSDIGSRLACELAIKLAAKDLAQRCLGNPNPIANAWIHAWLADDLPSRLENAWRQAIEADWNQRELPEVHQNELFSPQTYGSTVGLVVLTPYWWAHTGLGDWDLVLLGHQQSDRIVSQEMLQGHQGEATQSLCLPNANQCFRSRTAIYPIGNEPIEAFGLVLSTDGLRKSCPTDAEHLALSRFLLEEVQTHQDETSGTAHWLDSSLDRISREGCGDDVSVALACFGTLQEGNRAGAKQRPIAIGSDCSPASQGKQRPHPTTKPNIGHNVIALAVIGALAMTALIWLKAGKIRPSAAHNTQQTNQSIKLTSAQQTQLSLEAEKLCAKEPSQIKTILDQRRDIAKNSANPSLKSQLIDRKDWLGSLILSYNDDQDFRPKASIPCQKLNNAMRSYWRADRQAKQ